MRRALSLIGGLVLAVAFSQFPEYAQQYVQRLGGAVDELARTTQDFDRAAAEGGLSRDEALVRYAQSQDDFLEGRGYAMGDMFARYASLSATLAQVQGASPWERAQMLPDYFDSEIGRRTLDDFKPAVPVTVEGFAYAGVGLVAGYLLVSALWWLLALPARLRRNRNVVYRTRY